MAKHETQLLASRELHKANLNQSSRSYWRSGNNNNNNRRRRWQPAVIALVAMAAGKAKAASLWRASLPSGRPQLEVALSNGLAGQTNWLGGIKSLGKSSASRQCRRRRHRSRQEAALKSAKEEPTTTTTTCIFLCLSGPANELESH